MKSLIICVSVSHANTKRIARAMAEVLGAEVVEPEDVDPGMVGEYDLVGFGSGIYFMAFHPRLRELIGDLPERTDSRAFVFCTSGSPEPPVWPYTRRLRELLARKGFDVVGSFSCRGFDSWLPLRLIGGLNKGRPDAADLDRARAFARELLAATNPSWETETSPPPGNRATSEASRTRSCASRSAQQPGPPIPPEPEPPPAPVPPPVPPEPPRPPEPPVPEPPVPEPPPIPG